MTPKQQKRLEWKERLQQLQAQSDQSVDLALVHLDDPDELFGPPFEAFQRDLSALVEGLSDAAKEVPAELAEQYEAMIPRFSQGRAFLAWTLLQYRKRHHP